MFIFRSINYKVNFGSPAYAKERDGVGGGVI